MSSLGLQASDELDSVLVEGSISRSDGATLADDRLIWFEVRDLSGDVIQFVGSSSGTFTWQAPSDFRGSITPFHPDTEFDPPVITYASQPVGAASLPVGQVSEEALFTALYTYYVDKDGVSGFVGNDNNPGTSTTPLATIQEAMDRALPGDTIIIRGGTYTQDQYPPNVEVRPVVESVRSGTSTHPITIKAYDPINEPVIVDAEGDRLRNIEIRDVSHITIDGIIAQGAKNENFHINASEHITIRNCTARRNTVGFKAGFGIFGPSRYCLIERCISTENGRGFLMSGTVETSDPSQQNRPRFNTIRRCIAFGNVRNEENGDGIQILAGSDNLIDRCMAFDNADDGFDCTRGSHRNKITNCVSFAHPHNPNGDGDGNGFKIGVWGQAPADSDGGGADCVMRNCIAFGNDIGLSNNAVRLQTYNCQFSHNRVFGIVFDESTGHDGEAIMFNNLIFANGEDESNGEDVAFSFSVDNPVLTSDYNYIGDGSSTNDHPDENSHELHSIFGTIVGPPGLNNPNNAGVSMNVAAPDFPFASGFLPTTGSVLIDAGFSVSQSYPGVEFPDITPHAGIIGANVYDIGAYEFVSDDPDAEFLVQCQRDCDCVLGAVSQAHGAQLASDLVDVCDYHYCDSDGFCSSCARAYGSLCGSLSGAVQTSDILCVVAGFGDYCACPNGDVWDSNAAGCNELLSPELCKGPSGFPMTTDDILAVIGAFGGADPFDCEINAQLPLCDSLDLESAEGCPEPATNSATSLPVTDVILSDPTSGDPSVPDYYEPSGVVRLVPRNVIVPAGSPVVVDLFVADKANVIGFQAGIVVSGGLEGELETLDADVDSTRTDYVFAGLQSFAAKDLNAFRAAGVTTGTGVVVPEDEFAYMCTFTLETTLDDRGLFEIHPHSGHTALWTVESGSARRFSVEHAHVAVIGPANPAE